MPPKRRVAASLATPNYLRSGLLLDPSTTAAPQANDTQHPWTYLGVPEAKEDRCASLKWVIDRSVIPQCLLARIVEDGRLPLSCCLFLVGETADAVKDIFTQEQLALHIDVFPSRLVMLVLRGGKVMQMKDAGIRPTHEPAVLELALVQAATLFGRDRSTVDIPLDHPSCSGQHAVVANRMTFMDAYATELRDTHTSNASTAPIEAVSDLFDVALCLMDLGSTHGTTVNDVRLAPHKWHTLKPLDRVVFGLSSREYVFVEHNASKS
jgi:hypothetical protein